MKRLITVGMAFAIVCFVASLACAQSTKWKYGECPPGVNKISQPTCSDVKDTYGGVWIVPPPEDQSKKSEWKYGECPPGVNKISQPTCSNVTDTIRPTWSAEVSPIEDLSTAFGQAPAWNTDGGFPGSGRTACPKCGKAYPVNSRLKWLEHQP